MVFPRPASRGTELIPRPKPQFGDPWGPLHHRRSPFLGFVFNPQVITIECERKQGSQFVVMPVTAGRYVSGNIAVLTIRRAGKL
jgi:hypothetical protein